MQTTSSMLATDNRAAVQRGGGEEEQGLTATPWEVFNRWADDFAKAHGDQKPRAQDVRK